MTLDAGATQTVAQAVVEARQKGQPIETEVTIDGKVVKVFMWTAVAAVAATADEAAKCAAGIVAQVIEDPDVQDFLAELERVHAGSSSFSSIEETATSQLEVRNAK